MNENDTVLAAVLNRNALKHVNALRLYLLSQPGEEVRAEVIGQALDALLDVGESLLGQLIEEGA